MTYIPNDTDAVKNFYEVHLRKTKTFEDVDRVYQLNALANDLGVFGVTTLINMLLQQGIFHQDLFEFLFHQNLQELHNHISSLLLQVQIVWE